MKYGVGVRLAVTLDAEVLQFRSKSFVWRIAGREFNIPSYCAMGNIAVDEYPDGDDRFAMTMKIVHPLFGELFRYQGRFAAS